MLFWVRSFLRWLSFDEFITAEFSGAEGVRWDDWLYIFYLINWRYTMDTMKDLNIKKLGLMADRCKAEALESTGIRKEILLTQSKIFSLKQKKRINENVGN
jgi:hypothetical protein